MINFTITEKDDLTVVEFDSEDILTADDLRTLSPPEVKGSKGVVLSGRGPIWLYCCLAHFYHPTTFVATYDPRLEGAVVVESHCTGHFVGEVIKL